LLQILASLLASLIGFWLIYVLTGKVAFNGKTSVFIDWFTGHMFITIMSAIINVFAPTAFLVVACLTSGSWGKLSNPLYPQRYRIAAILTVFGLISIGAGGNLERFFFWSLLLVVPYVMPYIDRLVVNREYVSLAIASVLALLFQQSFSPIEPTGFGGCSLGPVLAGYSTWMGHRAIECPPLSNLKLVGVYSLAGVAVAATGFATFVFKSMTLNRSRSV
jgi:hypothetical protein